MAKSYSYDLRQKVIQAIELDSLKKIEVSKLFNISRNTINLWLQRKARTGDFQANNKKTPRSDRKITDWQKFRSFVKMHGDKTQNIWLNFGKMILVKGLSQEHCTFIGFTRKKRLMVTANAMNLKDKSF